MGVFLNAVEDCMQKCAALPVKSGALQTRGCKAATHAHAHARHMRRSTSTHPDQHLLRRKGIKPSCKVQPIQPVHNEGAPELCEGTTGAE